MGGPPPLAGITNGGRQIKSMIGAPGIQLKECIPASLGLLDLY